MWYTDHLQEPLGEALDTTFTKSHLIYCLMNADFDHKALEPGTDWADFFAAVFIEHHAPSKTPPPTSWPSTRWPAARSASTSTRQSPAWVWISNCAMCVQTANCVKN